MKTTPKAPTVSAPWSCPNPEAIPTQTPESTPDIARLIALHESRHRKNTRGVNHALLKQLTAFAGGSPSISDLNDDFCAAFAQFLTGRVAANSVRTYLHKLRALLRHAVNCRMLPNDPMPALNELIPSFACPRRTYLTAADLEHLYNTPCRHSETKRAFLFACQTGLRLSDIETLQWKDLLNPNETPTIVKTQVKTGRQVHIPLNSLAQRLLGTPRADGPVFSLMSRSVISTDLRQWASDAGIDKHLTFHVSRHTFATLSITAGVDIYVVSKLCGHANVRTTEIYAHMVDNTLRQGVDKLGRLMAPIQPMIPKSWFQRLKNKTICLIHTLRRQNKIPVAVWR